MAGAGTVVNLLDLRDDEDTKAQGRWAGRNPKAKAKGGRQRRQRNRAGDAAAAGTEGRKSGFDRKQSDVSNFSDYSDVDEDEVGATKSNVSTAEPGAPSGDAPKPAPSPPPGPPAAAAAEAPAAAPPHRASLEEPLVDNPGGVALPQHQFDIEDPDEPFAEAKKIANLRKQFENVEPGLQGAQFKQNVWEFYMVKGAWADPLCEALNHPGLYVPFFLPFAWPYRLCRTIQRAAPVKVKCCCKCACPLGSCCACPSVLFIFSLPILAALTFLPQVATIMKEQFKNIPVIKDQPNQDTVVLMASLGIVFLGLGLLLFWWARILLGVGMKYNISEALNAPDKFVCKAMCCICATNMRVGMHVDRAQGFDREHKGDRTLIQVSDTIAMQTPPQATMV